MSKGRVIEVESSSHFYELIENCGDKLVVVDFVAAWCGPCRQIGPKFITMSKEFTNVLFISIDVDELDELSESLGISCMPTFHLYKNADKIDEFCGANHEKLRALIDMHVNK